MVISLVHISTVLCIFTGLLLGGLLLFSPYYQNKANNLLGGVFGTIALLGITFILADSGVDDKWFVIINDVMWEYLVAPFFLLFLSTLLQHPLAVSTKRYWLYAPFLFTLVINLVLDLDMELGLIDIGVADDTPTVLSYYMLEYTGTILYTMAICIWARGIINKGREQPGRKLANELWWWLTAATLVWSFSWWFDAMVSFNITIWLYFVLLLMFFRTGYKGVVQLQLATSKKELRAILDDKYILASVPMVSTVNRNIENIYLMEFTRLMQEEKLYRNPKLSRDLVAERLGISNSHLSAQLSDSELGSFNDYVNSWRVEEAKVLLRDPQFGHYSILSIGLEAGFNSKSAFYSAFRKSTGQTPRGFKDGPSANENNFNNLCCPELSGNHN